MLSFHKNSKVLIRLTLTLDVFKLDNKFTAGEKLTRLTLTLDVFKSIFKMVFVKIEK